MTDGPPNAAAHIDGAVTISVDGQPVTLRDARADARQIKAAAGLAENLELYGPDHEPIAQDEHIELHDGEQFTTGPKLVKIIVNNRDVEVPGHEVTGAQILAAAEVPADFKLYGPDGSEIAPDQTIRVKHDECFTAISGQDVS
jgi:Multiubiquitin